MRRPISTAFIILITLVLSAYTAIAGNLPGQITNYWGYGQPFIFTGVSMYGSSSTGVGTSSTSDDADPTKDGIFYFPNLPAGTYSQGFSEKETFEAVYRKDISVPASGDAAWSVLQYTQATFCPGTEWYQVFHSWYAQSFRATGDNVISVGLRSVGTDGAVIRVSVMDGDTPYAPQIGPTRTLTSNTNNGTSAYWSAGEVPTIPGHIYTVKFNREDGGTFSPWHQTVRRWMRSENPDGRTWVDGVETDEPLEMTVAQDESGLINTMCCARDISSQWFTNHVGQTFTAKGTNLLMVTWKCGVGQVWEVTVYDGVGGPQVGPTKYAKSVAWNDRSVVTFVPGEVPTVAGRTYYVKLRPTAAAGAGEAYVLYHVGSSYYSGGTAYVDGNPQSYDWAMGIYEEKSTGSLDKPKVNISNFRMGTISATSATVLWSTDRVSTSTVNYGETTPYTQEVYAASPVTSHSVTLNNLKPNTMYHVRVISAASGAREGVSKDMVFVTGPGAVNFLADPGFESGAFGSWTKYGPGNIQITGPWFANAGPYTGSYGLAGAVNGGTVQGGAYQRVQAVNGSEYRFSGWVFTYCEGNFQTRSSQTIAKIGIDPYGGTNPDSINIIWTSISNFQNKWTNVAVSAIAKSNYVTVFVYGGNDSGNGVAWSIWSFDDLVLTTDLPPIDVTVSQAINDYPNESYVRLTNPYCTATSAQVGAAYVETPTRTNAIRVETTSTIAYADKVTVSGILRTKPTGEKYLASAVVTRSYGGILKPFHTSCKSLGGNAAGNYCSDIPGTIGPYNVGMLMKVTGKVKATGTGYIYINDGSLPANGLKVVTTSVTTSFTAGQNVSIVGIVQLEGAAGSAVAVIRPRNNSDVKIQ